MKSFVLVLALAGMALIAPNAEARLFQRLRANRGGCGASNAQPIRAVTHRVAGIFSGGGCSNGQCQVR